MQLLRKNLLNIAQVSDLNCRLEVVDSEVDPGDLQQLEDSGIILESTGLAKHGSGPSNEPWLPRPCPLQKTQDLNFKQPHFIYLQ